jgi:DNA-binding CsgD family transcriptional regulator
MDETEQVSDLIGDIYDAALDPALSPLILEAAIFVRKAAFDLPHPLETIASAFELTPADLRVMMAIIEVGGVPEVAPVLGISETTVKTHLQHVFEKTGTQRQADRVKLVAGYISPLAG